MKFNLRLCVLALSLSASAMSHAAVEWRNDAAGVLSMNETIVDNHNSTWTYNYSFSNVQEANPIWWVILYTNTDVMASTSFADASHTGWNNASGSGSQSGIHAPEGQSHYVYSWSASDAWPANAPHGIATGQTVGGFSFTSTQYDASSKRFVADRTPEWNTPQTLSGDQSFSYGGMTAAVPEPETYAMLLAGLGLMGTMARRRKQKTTV